MEDNDKQNYKDTQESLDDIPVNIPRWVLSSGTFIVLFMIIIGVAVLWSIKFPETIVAPVEIINEYETVLLKANGAGNNLKVLVSDNDYVKQGAFLAMIENDVKMSEITKLLDTLLNIKKNLKHIKVLNSIEKHNMNLGAIQKDYLSFIKTLDEYIHINNEDIINEDIHYFENQMKLLRNKYDKANKKDRHNIQYSISKLEKELFDYKIKTQNNKKRLFIEVQTSYLSLMNRIKQWDDLYLIKAPINGNVSLINRNHKKVNKGDMLMKINPKENTYIAKLIFNRYPSGKIKKGQEVKISLNAYPRGEYGILIGQLDNIPDELTHNKLILTVDLGDQLITDFEYNVPYRTRLLGRGSIILSDTRLLYRLFYQFRAVFK